MYNFNNDFLRFMARAWDASSINFTVHEVDFEYRIGSGFGRGRGMPGLRRAPLNLIMKKKQPRNTPWGADPGRDLGDETAPWYLRTILLPVR